MVSYMWAFLIVVGTVVGIATGKTEAVSQAALEGAKDAATLCLGLIGAYALWLGTLNIAQEAGLVNAIARRMRGLIRWLFPSIPPDGPASGFITLNLVANMLGMGNAATPFGLKAMKELQALNPHKTRASDAMCMFLVINASSVQLMPLTVIALRSAAGAAVPGDIAITSLIATTVTTVTGVAMAKILRRLYP
ncbi:MAG: nucleoside recognition domain-containing protein [Christensenellales bacterium]|jgi:spore maturation protein A